MRKDEDIPIVITTLTQPWVSTNNEGVILWQSGCKTWSFFTQSKQSDRAGCRDSLFHRIDGCILGKWIIIRNKVVRVMTPQGFRLAIFACLQKHKFRHPLVNKSNIVKKHFHILCLSISLASKQEWKELSTPFENQCVDSYTHAIWASDGDLRSPRIKF